MIANTIPADFYFQQGADGSRPSTSQLRSSAATAAGETMPAPGFSPSRSGGFGGGGGGGELDGAGSGVFRHINTSQVRSGGYGLCQSSTARLRRASAKRNETKLLADIFIERTIVFGL